VAKPFNISGFFKLVAQLARRLPAGGAGSGVSSAR
jgi:hypothetical protein